MPVYKKYHFKVGNKVVHGGITKDPVEREQQHQQKWPNGHMKIVGWTTSLKRAREWEREHGFENNTKRKRN